MGPDRCKVRGNVGGNGGGAAAADGTHYRQLGCQPYRARTRPRMGQGAQGHVEQFLDLQGQDNDVADAFAHQGLDQGNRGFGNRRDPGQIGIVPPDGTQPVERAGVARIHFHHDHPRGGQQVGGDGFVRTAGIGQQPRKRLRPGATFNRRELRAGGHQQQVRARPHPPIRFGKTFEIHVGHFLSA